MKHPLLTTIGILIFLLNFQISQSYCQEETLSVNKLLKDFKQLEAVFDAHPDPYTHISEEELKASLDATKASLDRPHTILEFYRKMATLVALIKDGHSSVRLPKYWLRTQRKARGGFPFEVYLTNEDELYVIKKFNDSNIPIGSQIIEINGLNVDSFLSKIDPYISYEVKSFRNTLIDEDFEQFLYLAFGFTEETNITYTFDDKTESIAVKNIPYKEWKSYQKDNKEERESKIARGEPYSYQKIKDGVGLLNVYAFYASDLEKYDLFLAKSFKDIKKDNIHSLIIDIRGNFGGWPIIASRIFHYISETYFKTMGISSMKVSNAYRKNIISRLPANINLADLRTLPRQLHFIDINAALNRPINSFANETILFNEEPQTETYEFNGDCYLLINRDSYSAASSFASTFQCYQMGGIIGEETGGTKIFRANAMYEVLGKSKFVVAMSTTKLFTACFNKEHEGVRPTVYFTPSVQDICSGKDAQLLYLIGLIDQVQKTQQTSEGNE